MPTGADRSEASARSACQSIRGLGGRTPGRSLTRTRSARQVWGVARYETTETGRTDRADRLGIAVYGRDAADARLFTKVGRFVLYRDSGPSLTITRLQQVEHEAYLTLRAGRAGARRVRPQVHQVWANLRQVAVSPRKLVLLASGSFAQPLLVAMALSVALRAFGDHRWLPVLIVVITLAGFIGGISPSPGGMGVVEAGMILGLTATGVSEADATAAVFIQRLFTS